MKLSLVVVAALSLSALAGCSSSEPRETTTVHCMKCHRSVSTECVMCTDCAAPKADPTAYDDPRTPVGPDARPDVRPANTTPGNGTGPTSSVPANTPVADGARRRSVARTIFLNGFPQADSDAVEAELLANPDFVDVTPGGGAPGRRVAIELRYAGLNMNRDLVAIMRKLHFRFHFTEAKLQEQVELVKDKD